MNTPVLFWHRNDLRIVDNVGLTAAVARSPKTVAVFCLDPAILERDDVAPARVDYMLGCLRSLRNDYQDRGGDLLMLQGDPTQEIPALAERLGATHVMWNWDVEPYARSRDRQVLEALTEKGIQGKGHWDRIMHAPDAVMTGSGTPYKVYSPFWKNWRSHSKADPYPAPEQFESLTAAELETANSETIPQLRSLDMTWDGGFILDPGTQSAVDTLDSFCTQSIEAYDGDRNFPALETGTSKLSAALKFGAIGIRQCWAAAEDMGNQSRSDEGRAGVTTWQQELAWREFYQHVMYHFPELADGPYRDQMKNFPWENDEEKFEAWCEGRTGYPIVDAAMRQLNEIGWMHNRCRMIVASFLTKDLIIDWRWGEKYFMQNLIDGDLSANNGGWQWSASSGMDPKPLRIFNPASQAKKYDPDGDYIRQWLPEIRTLDTGTLISGNITPMERQGIDYPGAIVDHKIQQNRFKQIYKAQRES
ncbi:MAG: FAD-binding domain-containing protein [Cyanophyceae cyanobacterium]